MKDKISSELFRQIYLKPTINFQYDLIESLDHLNNVIVLLNRSFGGQFFFATMCNMTSLILLTFILAFKIGGENLEEKYTISTYLVVVAFSHNFILIPCLLGDLIERKVKITFG